MYYSVRTYDIRVLPVVLIVQPVVFSRSSQLRFLLHDSVEPYLNIVVMYFLMENNVIRYWYQVCMQFIKLLTPVVNSTD